MDSAGVAGSRSEVVGSSLIVTTKNILVIEMERIL